MAVSLSGLSIDPQERMLLGPEGKRDELVGDSREGLVLLALVCDQRVIHDEHLVIPALPVADELSPRGFRSWPRNFASSRRSAWRSATNGRRV